MRQTAWVRHSLVGIALALLLVGCDASSEIPAPSPTERGAIHSTPTPVPEATQMGTPPAGGAATTSRPDLGSPASSNCGGPGRRVCLVPLEDFAEPPVESLVQHLLDLGIPAAHAPAVGLEFADIDRMRLQLGARAALGRVDAAYPHLVRDPDVTVIALTDRDMFIEGATYNWVFGMRGSGSYIISTARMYEETWGGFRDDAARDSRLRKMLLRYVGLFHLGLEENGSPLTVLYRHLDGLPELDAMREGILEPSQLPTPATALAQWAADFCGASERSVVALHRADVEFGRSFAADGPIAEALPAAGRYLASVAEAFETYVAELGSLRGLAASDSAASRFHTEAEDLYRWTLAEVQRSRLQVASSKTTAEVAGRLYELFVGLSSYPGLESLYDGYLALGLEANVALVEAGPCGGFAPATFYGGQEV